MNNEDFSKKGILMAIQIDLADLAKRENERVEWKENVASIEKVVQTAVAFANDYSNLGGGYIICGAKEIQDEHGFQSVNYIGLSSSKLKEIQGKVISHCKEKISPPIVPLVEEIVVPNDESKRILVFIISATKNAHSYRSDSKDSSTYYIRMGSNTIETKGGLLRELLLRKHEIEPWDKRLNPASQIDSIDLLIFREYLQEMGLWSPNKAIEDYISEKEKLADFTPPLAGKLGMQGVLRLKNFAILMFGKNPLDYFVGAYSIFSTYKSKDRSEPTGERKLIHGTIVQQAKKLIQLLNAESYTAFDKTTEVPNQEKYPVLALKEAVVNAIVHRDYESDQQVRVTVFSDRIEIYSPGSLPYQVNEEKFKAGKATAYWRNQSLNYLFNRLQLAQAEGQGIPTIINSMQQIGSPPPRFEIGVESLTCILPAHPRHQLLRELNEIENKIVIRNYDDAYNKLVEILEKDIYNFRALELFCEVNNLLETPGKVAEFVMAKSIDFDKINPNTLIIIAETLTTVTNIQGVSELTQNILDKAVNSKLEEQQIKRIAFSLRKLGGNEKADEFLSGVFSTHPSLSKSPVLLQIRARARIDLAKICEESAKRKNLNPRTRALAWDKLRLYLDDAEKDLKIALEHVTSLTEKEWLQTDLVYLVNMKERAQKPVRSDSSVHVGNIPFNASKQEIRKLFSKYGVIKRLIIPNIASSNGPLYAHVEYSDKKSVYSALDDRYNIRLHGKKIYVNRFDGKRKKRD